MNSLLESESDEYSLNSVKGLRLCWRDVLVFCVITFIFFCLISYFGVYIPITSLGVSYWNETKILMCENITLYGIRWDGRAEFTSAIENPYGELVSVSKDPENSYDRFIVFNDTIVWHGALNIRKELKSSLEMLITFTESMQHGGCSHVHRLNCSRLSSKIEKLGNEWNGEERSALLKNVRYVYQKPITLTIYSYVPSLMFALVFGLMTAHLIISIYNEFNDATDQELDVENEIE